MLIRTTCRLALLSLAVITPCAAQEPPVAAAGGKDHAGAIKESLARSMAALRQYQWVETTVISVKGEEKSRTQNSCQYGADGTVQKSPLGPPQQDEGKTARGLRGRIVEKKKTEMTDAMKEAVALVKQYVPPDPTRIQAARDAGKISTTLPDSKGQIRVVVNDYLKAEDSVELEVDAATDRISGVTVATFTQKEKDAVGMKISFEVFPDGTVYPAKIRLDVTSQKLVVAIENSDYKKLEG